MSELEELMKLLKVNNQISYTNHYSPGTGPLGPSSGPSLGGVSKNKGVSSGSMVIMSNYDDVTDVSGLNIDRLHGGPAPKRGVIANEGSINSGSD